MQHPFSLQISDLESQLSNQDTVEELGEQEAESISGGLSIYTKLGKEEGGYDYPYYPFPCPKDIRDPRYLGPPDVTTLALGEEGGDCLIKPIKPPIYATTQAIGEEGGGDIPYIE